MFDDIISHRRVPKPESDSALRAKTLVKRAADYFWPDEYVTEHAVLDVTNLSSRKEAFEKTRSRSSMESTLEHLLGTTGSPCTIPWPRNGPLVRNEHGDICYCRYYHSIAAMTAHSILFIIDKGSIVCTYFCSAVDFQLCCIVKATHRLFGACFVYGLMDGEEIESVEPLNL